MDQDEEFPDLAEFEGEDEEDKEKKEVVTEEPGASSKTPTNKSETVIVMPAPDSSETKNDLSSTQRPASPSAPLASSEDSSQKAPGAAIPLPPPDETTALNTSGDKKNYNSGKFLFPL